MYKLRYKNTRRNKIMKKLIENHQTAAWTCHIIKKKPESNVSIPCYSSVIDAKEYINENQR
ncbi:DUF3787 domain-containing protein [Clostridium sp.]|uniref:DUF3787 domain-containing protein n=1 Tax=Clostridium sp. TaxID=1506 RepID=UPI002FC8D962